MKEFPEVLYRGNSAYTELEVWIGDLKYTFQAGDVVSIGIKRFVGDKNYIINKDFEISHESSSMLISLTPEETKNISPCNGVLEISMKYNQDNDYKTIYQEKIELKEVVIHDS